MPERIVVTSLTSDPTDPQVAQAVDEVCHRLGQATGSLLDYLGEEVLTQRVRRHSWLARDGSLVVHAVDDAQADARYVEVLSESEDLVVVVADALGAILPVVSLEETLEQVEAQVLDLRALNRLGLLGSDRADDRIVEVLTRSMAHGSDAVRLVAVNAAGLLSWPELVPSLDALCAAEPDPDVRQMAERAVSLCRPTRR